MRRNWEMMAILAAAIAIVVALFALGVGCEPKRDRAEVRARLGDRLLGLVEGCSRIESYRVSGYEQFLDPGSLDEIDRIRFITTSPPGAGYEGGYPIKRKSNDLTPRQAGMLIDWINDPYSYDRKDPLCREFEPSLCFRFVRGRTEAVLLIDIECSAWVFLYEGGWISSGCSRLKRKFMDFGEEFFPDYFG